MLQELPIKNELPSSQQPTWLRVDNETRTELQRHFDGKKNDTEIQVDRLVLVYESASSDIPDPLALAHKSLLFNSMAGNPISSEIKLGIGYIIGKESNRTTLYFFSLPKGTELMNGFRKKAINDVNELIETLGGNRFVPPIPQQLQRN